MKAITEEFAARFKRSYAYKMGGKQTLQFPNGQTFTFDDRQYYSGRGAKYNSSIRHDDLGIVPVSKKEFAAEMKLERERAKIRKENAKLRKEKERRMKAAKKMGFYSVAVGNHDYNIELSDEEHLNNKFDAVRLARTLSISVEDAELLKSRGKTYVFAKTSTGQTLLLYHADLSANNLYISVSIPTQEFINSFYSERESWVSAPFADLVGQTENENHFVC